MADAGHDHDSEGDALELLEDENRSVSELFRQFDASEGPSVTERYDHGNFAKELIRHMGVRESAKTDLARGLDGVDDLSDVRDRLNRNFEERRTAMDTVDEMARGIQGIALNEGQDFNGAVESLRSIVEPEIDWELSVAIPRLQSVLPPERRAQLFHDTRYLKRHASSNPDPKGRKWYERLPGLSQLLATKDRALDYPRESRDVRKDES